MRLILVAFVACGVVALIAPLARPGVASAQSAPAGPPTVAAPPPPVGRVVDLGGYRLHLACTGRGSPTVVLLPGAGDFSVDWALVQPGVAQVTRVCAYDRGGEAWSDLGPAPRTLDQEVYDLHRLLAAARERGPYVLVGHSLGGMVARLFATTYPGETAGLVLVDAFSEDAQLSQNGHLVRIRLTAKPRAIPPPRATVGVADRLRASDEQKIRAFMAQYVGQPTIAPPYDRLPPTAQRARVWALSQPAHYASGDDYLPEIAARVYAETQATAHPLGTLPLVVLARSRDAYPPDVAAMLSREHREQQQRLVALSTAGTLVVVPAAGHHIHLDQPAAVVRAITQVVRRTRR